MPRIHPLHLFPPHIAERGLLYFEQGKVRDVQQTSSGRYRAEVCGSENYSVWLKLDSDLYIKQAVACNRVRAFGHSPYLQSYKTRL